MAKGFEEVQITVEKILERNGRYSFVDEDGEWYGLNKSRPRFEEGDTVQFEFSRNGKYKNVEGTVHVVSGGDAAPAAPKKARAADIMTKDDYWARKEANDVYTQREIRWQASRNAALEFLKVALSVDALPLTKKGVDKEELLTEYLNVYTQQFYTDTFAMRERNEAMIDVASLTNNNEYGYIEDENDLESLRKGS